MQRVFSAAIYSLVIAVITFFVVYIGIESFDIREGDYIEINGEFHDLTPQIMAPIKLEQLFQRYPERMVIGGLACPLLLGFAAWITGSVPRFSRPIAGFVIAAFGGFIVYGVCVYFFGFTDWSSSMLSALSIAPGLGAYCLIAFLYSHGWPARMADSLLIFLSIVFAISWTQILRFLFA